ncbi:uncharacterized protein LOC143530036 [Bidens hawaiensis]|uniref:uncharacterized protein LOC143530036 n=1 Tax=Bidens hawaiensis TaxID=980011 RepID=UPI00404A4105
MEELSTFWSHQENNDELKLKIHYTALELEAVRAKANEEMNKNTESVKQLLQLLKLVCHERDEARDQIQKLQNKFLIDQVHQHHQYLLIKPSNANSSIAESYNLSDAYNNGSSPVNSLFDPVTSPEFINMNTNYQMLPNGAFHEMHSTPIMNRDHATLMMENMIIGKALPQKGNLLKTVMEAGPLLQALLATNPLPGWGNSSGSFSQMIGDDGIMSFNFVNSSNCQGRVTSNFSPVEKRQRFR